jgi:hypothetical protein
MMAAAAFVFVSRLDFVALMPSAARARIRGFSRLCEDIIAASRYFDPTDQVLVKRARERRRPLVKVAQGHPTVGKAWHVIGT